MMLQWALFRWQWRNFVLATLPAMLLSGGYVLFHRTPFSDFNGTGLASWLLIGLHAFAISLLLGQQVQPGHLGFLLGRGFSRPVLWLHTLLTSLASVLCVWLFIAASIWLGLRSGFQATVLQNPEYPVMAPLDYPYPWLWLVMYLFALSVFQYGWIREAQPTQGAGIKLILMSALAAAAFAGLALTRYREPWVVGLAVGAAVIVSAALFLAQYRLYQSLEVRG